MVDVYRFEASGVTRYAERERESPLCREIGGGALFFEFIDLNVAYYRALKGASHWKFIYFIGFILPPPLPLPPSRYSAIFALCEDASV